MQRIWINSEILTDLQYSQSNELTLTPSQKRSLSIANFKPKTICLCEPGNV